MIQLRYVRFINIAFVLVLCSAPSLFAQTIIETDGNFNLYSNGTVKCTAAANLETGTLNSITYTKRTAAQITTSNAATSCTSGITSMFSLFGFDNLSSDISSWDVSSVTDMSFMFSYNFNFNTNLSTWDVSNVTNMQGMFIGASAFDQDLSTWDVGSVTDMDYMFDGATAFNQDLSNWCVGRITSEPTNFGNAGSDPNWGTCINNSDFYFGGVSDSTLFCPNADNLDSGTINGVTYTKRTAAQITTANAATSCTSGITTMHSMFKDSTTFNTNINSWDVSGVTNISYMFYNAESFNQELSAWNVSNVDSMRYTFAFTDDFNQDISSWDVSSVNDMNSMFYRASTFNSDISSWDVSNVTNMSGLFSGSVAFTGDISSWDVSNVTNMSEMFKFNNTFNGDINSWNVSSVTNMNSMFHSAHSFNSDISSWDVSSVTDMSLMFAASITFNGDISRWDVSSVTNMSEMFLSANAFNVFIGAWDVSSVVLMDRMFSYAISFNQDLSTWDVSSVTNMSEMFLGAIAFNVFIGAWDVSSVVLMDRMFDNAISFNQDLSTWCVNQISSEPLNFSYGSLLSTSNKPIWGTCPTFGYLSNGITVVCLSASVGDTGTVGGVTYTKRDVGQISEVNAATSCTSGITDMNNMFYNLNTFNGDISSWDVSSVTNMAGMFSGNSTFNGDISEWDVSSVTDMSWMFSGNSVFNGDVSRWDVRSVTNMTGMFSYNSGFNKDISEWDVSNVTNMYSMFWQNIAFNSDISDWDVSSVTNMSYMFNNFKSFNGDLSKWDVSSVTDMSYMFSLASTFNSDISGWDVSSVTNMSYMFLLSNAFNVDVSNWDVSSVTKMGAMFYGANSFDQDLGSWNVESVASFSVTGQVNTHFLVGSGLSSANYDSLLLGWSKLDLVDNLIFDVGPVQYSLASAAARETIISNHGWSIVDGGLKNILTPIFTLSNPNLITYPDSVLTIPESFFTINPNYSGSNFTFKVSGTYSGNFYSDNNDNMVFDTGDEYITSSNGVELGSSSIRYLNTSAGYSSPKFHLSVGAESDSSHVSIFSVVTQPQIQGIANEGGWYLLANPFTTSVGELLDNVWTQGAINSDAPGGSPTLYTFDEQTAAYQAITGDIATDTLEAGEGLLVYLYAFDDVNAGIPEGGGWPKTLANYGNPFSDHVSIPIKTIDVDNSGNTTGFEGLKLFGNPFSWELSIDSLIAELVSVDALANRYIYRWDPLNKRYDLSNTGAIKPYESVFIRTITSGLDANITLEYDDFYQATPAKTILEQPFEFVLHHLDEDLESRSQLQFTEQASVDIDPFDGYYLGSYASKYANLYTQIGDQNLSINNLPAALDEVIEFPLYMDASVSGAFELDWNRELLPAEWAFTLEEVATGMVIDLKQQDYVSFTHGEKAKRKTAEGEESDPIDRESVRRQATGQNSVQESDPIDRESVHSNATTQSVAQDPLFILKINPFLNTDVEAELGAPTKMELVQNYPNPFNPSTTIQYTLSEQSAVTLEVFTLMGQKVSDLVQETQSAGRYSINFDASQISSGVYIYRLKAGNKVFTKKMTLIK